MFELTSEFGDIYEGHIVRLNKEKLVLLLASTYHTYAKLVHREVLKTIINNPNTKINTVNHFQKFCYRF